MSPADGWWWPEPRSPLGSTKPQAEPLPPRSVGVGTLWERVAFLAPPRASSLTVSVDSRTQSLAGWDRGVSTACRHVCVMQ